MKSWLLILNCFVFISQAEAALWEVTVNGTAAYQETFGTIRTEQLNTARIFREYNVSPESYALTTDTETGILYLLPRHAPITEQNQKPVLHNFEALSRSVFRLQPTVRGLKEVPVSNTNVTSTMFDFFRGTAVMHLREAGQVEDRTILKGYGDVVGSSGSRIFKFRFTLGKEFTPTPAL